MLPLPVRSKSSPSRSTNSGRAVTRRTGASETSRRTGSFGTASACGLACSSSDSRSARASISVPTASSGLSRKTASPTGGLSRRKRLGRPATRFTGARPAGRPLEGSASSRISAMVASRTAARTAPAKVSVSWSSTKRSGVRRVITATVLTSLRPTPPGADTSSRQVTRHSDSRVPATAGPDGLPGPRAAGPRGARRRGPLSLPALRRAQRGGPRHRASGDGARPRHQSTRSVPHEQAPSLRHGGRQARVPCLRPSGDQSRRFRLLRGAQHPQRPSWASARHPSGRPALQHSRRPIAEDARARYARGNQRPAWRES